MLVRVDIAPVCVVGVWPVSLVSTFASELSSVSILWDGWTEPGPVWYAYKSVGVYHNSSALSM